MPEDSASALLTALKRFFDELDESDTEFDLRYPLCRHVLEDALGWRKWTQARAVEGGFTIEKDRKDVRCLDDATPPFPVIIIETKPPAQSLELAHTEQLKTYVKAVGSVKVSALTNGRRIVLYSGTEMRKVADINVEALVPKQVGDLTAAERTALHELEAFRKERYVQRGDSDFLRQTAREVELTYVPGQLAHEGYLHFVASLKASLDDFQTCFERFFDSYQGRQSADYGHAFLEAYYKKWVEWREYSGGEGNPKEVFCRETGYIFLNRILFARLAEDKWSRHNRQLSGPSLASRIALERRTPYLDILEDTFRGLVIYYPSFFAPDIFDWWKLAPEKRSLLSSEEERVQRGLDTWLDNALRITLRRLNRFDFERLNRDILGHIYEDYLPPEERKRLGEFYTPIEVVQYILDKVRWTSDARIDQLHLLDPACGSGTFLVEAANRLVQRYVRKFKRGFIDRLRPEEARAVLEAVRQQVVGLDINPFACRISEINLLFQTIDLIGIVRRQDPGYEFGRFQIYCTDSLLPARSDGQTQLDEWASKNGRARAFFEFQSLADSTKRSNFDVIVGNPPYIRVQNLGTVRDTYCEIYPEAAVGDFDIYVLFLQRAREWLRSGGQLGFINPNRLLNAEYATPARRELLKLMIREIVDFRSTQVFGVATPYPIILLLENTSPPERHEIHSARVFDETPDLFRKLSTVLGSSYRDMETFDVFTMPQNQLDPQLWIFAPEDERLILEKMRRRGETLGTLCPDIFQGIVTGADDVFVGELLTESGALAEFLPKGHKKKGEPPVIVERALLKRLLEGTDIERWSPAWKGKWLLFPYVMRGSKAVLLSEAELRSDFRNAWNYFYGAAKQVLEGRENGQWRGSPNIHQFGRRQNIEKFGPPKIMLRVLSETSDFASDAEGTYVFVGGATAGGYGVLPTPSGGSIDFLTGLLNSPIVRFFQKHQAMIFQNKYYSWGRSFTSRIPIAKSGDPAPEENLVGQAAQELRKLTTETRAIQHELDSWPPPYQTSTTLAAFLDSQVLPAHKNQFNCKDIEVVATPANGWEVHFTKREFIVFRDESVAQFIASILARGDRISRAELLNLRLPKEEEIHRAWQIRIDSLATLASVTRDVSRLEGQLNDLCIKLYQLTEQEQAIVERFLAHA